MVSACPRESRCDSKEWKKKIAKHIFIFIYHKEKKKSNFSNIQNDTEAFLAYVNQTHHLCTHVTYTCHIQCMTTPEGREDIA